MHRGYSRLVIAALIVLAAYLAAASARGETAVERGKYLVTIMDCTGCHTTGALAGQPDPAMFLAGSTIGFEIPGYGIFYPPNLTSDAKTGIGAWSEQQIVDAIRTGVRPDGRGLVPIMPWPSYAALSDSDAKAVAAYLKSLPPISHAAPPLTGAGEKAPAPYLTVKMPE
jgi:mono/diheme cytochrome c family protein